MVGHSFQPFCPGIYTRDFDFNVLKIPIGLRTTVIPHHGGGFWMHSPGPLDDEDVRFLKSLIMKEDDPVEIVAPNQFHHLYLTQALKAFPSAKLYGPQILTEKRKKLTFQVLQPHQNFHDKITAFPIGGVPFFQEWTFYHMNSATLIVTDLISNINRPMGLWARFLLKVLGSYRRVNCSVLFRSQIKDKKEFRASLEVILKLPIERIILAHGDPIESNGSDILRRIFF